MLGQLERQDASLLPVIAKLLSLTKKAASLIPPSASIVHAAPVRGFVSVNAFRLQRHR